MNWNIKRKLKNISRESDPDPRFVRALELRIREEIAPNRRPWSARWKAAVVAFSTLSATCMGAGTYAYASDTVVPGHALYPVREAMEKAELRFPGSERRTKTFVRHLRRRLQEQKMLESLPATMPIRHLDRYVETLDRTITETQRLDPEKRRQIDEMILEIERDFSPDARKELWIREEIIRQRLNALPPDQRLRLQEFFRTELSNPALVR